MALGMEFQIQSFSLRVDVRRCGRQKQLAFNVLDCRIISIPFPSLVLCDILTPVLAMRDVNSWSGYLVLLLYSTGME